jgi:hypothetical protein
MNERRKTVCLGFDGVLFPYSRGWQDGTMYERPRSQAVSAVKTLAEKYRLAVSTCRISNFNRGTDHEQVERVRTYLRDYYGLRSTIDLARWQANDELVWLTSQKPIAMVYIDDRAVPFHPQHNNWSWVLQRTEDIIEGRWLTPEPEDNPALEDAQVEAALDQFIKEQNAWGGGPVPTGMVYDVMRRVLRAAKGAA